MKQTSTQQVRVPFKMCLVLFLTIFSLMFSKTSSAHNVLYYTPPCFTQGSTAQINVQIANAGGGTYYHWQWRVPGGAWTWLNGAATATNNTINGRTFSVTNASFKSATTANYPSTGAPLNPTLLIANVGSPAYTTELNGIQFRILMTDGLDPQTNTVNTWGGEEYLNNDEAKYVSLMAAPASYCYTVCPNNSLVTNPGTPTLATFYGGFEMSAGAGALTDNFSTPGATSCVTTKAAYSGITPWTGGTLTNNVFRIINNPDSMSSTFSAFAPHSGRQMMVVYNNTSTSNALWYRTIATSGSNFYQGTMTISFWVARTVTSGGTNPQVTLDVLGATTLNGGPTCAFTAITGATSSVTANVTGAAGIWQQVSLTFNVPVHTYKKLQFRIRANGTTTNPVSLAIDDICLNEPAAGLLPIIMTPLKGVYSNGVSHLTWSTLQESNSNYFEIERSNDGVNYTVIGKVSAKGSSDRQSDYSFNDVKVNGGTNYYRLRAVSKDADFKNSNIVALEVKIKGTNITGIYPNPFMDRVSVAVSSEVSGQAVIRLFDNTGKQIATQQSNITKGVNTVTVGNLAKLAAGFYMIKVQVGDAVITQKLIK